MGAAVQPRIMVLEKRDKDEPDYYLGPEGGIQGFVPTSSWEKKLNCKVWFLSARDLDNKLICLV